MIEYVQNFPYAVPNFDLSYTRQEIGIDVGYLRSVSHAPNCFAIESSIDELAAAAVQESARFSPGAARRQSRGTRRCSSWWPSARAGAMPPKGRYQGIAFMEGYTSHIAQVAEMSIEGGELKVHKITCVVDCGQTVNPRIVESQIESGIVYGLSAALWGDITLERRPRAADAISTTTACCACNETARARRAHHPERCAARRHRRDRRAAGGAGDLQCDIRGNGQAPAIAADRPPTQLASQR